MNPREFLKTIYLGDRACKSILIDGWNNRVVLQIDTISRIRSDSGNWEFYTSEDITEGLIVFTSMEAIRFEPPGIVPNDLINSIDVQPLSGVEDGERSQQYFVFQIFIGSVDLHGNSQEVMIEIVAAGIHLEDPSQPSIEITE